MRRALRTFPKSPTALDHDEHQSSNRRLSRTAASIRAAHDDIEGCWTGDGSLQALATLERALAVLIAGLFHDVIVRTAGGGLVVFRISSVPASAPLSGRVNVYCDKLYCRRHLKLRYRVLPGLLCLALASPAAAAGADEACACKRLVEVAVARRLAGTGKRGGYACERQHDAPRRYVFALRWRGEGLSEVGSNLVGYYEFNARSGDIHIWDLGEERRGEVLEAGTSPAYRSKCAVVSARKDRKP